MIRTLVIVAAVLLLQGADAHAQIDAKDHGYRGPVEVIRGAQTLSIHAGYEWNCTKTRRMVLAGEESKDVERFRVKSYRQSGKTKLALGMDEIYLIFDTGSRGADFLLEGFTETEPDRNVNHISPTQELDNFLREYSPFSKDEINKTLQGNLAPLLNRKIIQGDVFRPVSSKVAVSAMLNGFGLDVSINSLEYSYKNEVLGVTVEGGTQKVVLGTSLKLSGSNILISGDHRINLDFEGLGYLLIDVASGLNTAMTMKGNMEIESRSVGNFKAVYSESHSCGLNNEVPATATNQLLNQTVTANSEKISPSPLPEGSPEQKGSQLNESVISDTSALKDKLLELKELVDEGLITEEDYEKVKNQLLEKM